jgi:hypothetical protein
MKCSQDVKHLVLRIALTNFMDYKNYHKTTILDLWLKRDASLRKSEIDILSFYTEIQRNHSDLFEYLKNYSNTSDSYQLLKTFLPLDNSIN